MTAPYKRIVLKLSGEALIGDGEIVEPVLDHDGHLAGIAVREPVGDLDIGMHRVEGDEEMMLARQALDGDAFQHLLDQPAHRAMHQVSVVDRAVGRAGHVTSSFRGRAKHMGFGDG